MDKESKRQALVDSLKRITPEMQKKLEGLKRWGADKLEQPDFVWDALLRSFATWGGTRGYPGLIENQDNYRQVTFDALSKLDSDDDRAAVILKVFPAAKINRPYMKAPLMTSNYVLVDKMGRLEGAKSQALSQNGKDRKVAFMKRFKGIGDKYGRNIWMDVYDPDFHDAIAVDSRIQEVTKALGYSFEDREYDKHERFYQDIAKEAGLQGWALDRLLYIYKDHFLAKIAASEEEH